MFDGSFKSSRKVNLSGRKKPTFGYASSASSGASVAPPGGFSAQSASSKEEILLQSKLLREERIAHKKRTAASTSIQAMCRRVVTTRRVRTRVFCEVETELTQLLNSTDIRAQVVPTTTLQAFMRKFLVAFGRRGGVGNERILLAREVTAERLGNVQNYLIFMMLMSALRGGSSGDSNILAMKKDATWYHQVSKMLEIALRVAVETRFASTAEQATNPYILVLDTFTSLERYSAAQVPDANGAVLTLLDRLCVRREFSAFEAFRRLIGDSRHGPEGKTVQIITSVVMRALQRRYSQAISNPEDAVIRSFAQSILYTPNGAASTLLRNVMQGLSASSADAKEKEGAFWSNVLSHLCSDDISMTSWSDRAIAAGNVMDLLSLTSFLPAVVRCGSAVLSMLVLQSHIEWAFEVDTSEDQLMLSDDVDMDDDDSFGLASQGTTASLLFGTDESSMREARIGEKELDQWHRSIKSQWSQLCDAGFVRRTFEALEDEQSLQNLCNVYSSFLLGVGRRHLLSVRQSFKPPPQALFAFLSAVSAEPTAFEARLTAVPVLKRMWLVVKTSAAQLEGIASARHNGVFLRSLLVFNAIFSYTLLALDDETFYDRAWPFALNDVSDIVSFLKQFIFEVCWNVSSTASRSNEKNDCEKDLFPTLTTAVKLFNQLYDRDCRRRFSVDGDWLWPSMPAIKETIDFESMEGDLYELQALSSLVSSNASLSAHARVSLILTTLPQVFSFNDRVQLFEKLLEEEKQNVSHLRDEFSRAIQVRIKRDDIVDDSFDFFQKVCEDQSPNALKSRIKVTFINEQGLEEAGIDGGGVFKEYVDQLTKNAFSPEYGFFLSTDQHLLYPNPAARMVVDTPKEVTDKFRFLGRVLGKAVYENILVEPQFATFFLNKLLGKSNYIDDLHSLDPDLYRNLMQLKHFKGNVEDLSLTFSVTETEYGQALTRNLVPDGANIPVTNDNRIRYIHLLANYKLNVLSSHESAAFLRGFRDLIPAKWIQMFSPSELQTLIGGTANKIDIVDWQRHTAYGGGYHPSQRPIQWFWDIVENDFTDEDRAALLKFITSVSRQPLLGFGQLAPRICIHQVRIDDDERLPSSATCMNLLKLPTYSSKAIMKEKLLYAIRANAGFDLS